MIKAQVYVCIIPLEFWEEDSHNQGLNSWLSRLTAEALMAERRISKKVNLDIERRRYSLLCHRLENELLRSDRIEVIEDPTQISAVIDSSKFPAFLLTDGYLELLRGLESDRVPMRLGASFFPPRELKEHLDEFRQLAEHEDYKEIRTLEHRLRLFQHASEKGSGIIEFQDHFAYRTKPEPLPEIESLVNARKGLDAITKKSSLVILADDLHESDAFKSDYKQRQVKALSAAVIRAVKSGEPANFSNRSNDVITEVLHRFVYVLSPHAPTPFDVRIVYADGSEGRPFPIRCLSSNDPPEKADGDIPVLRAVLMSMRHVELDRVVDMAWFRNREVSKLRTLAETDEYCYQVTATLLKDALLEGPLRMQLYHTGFEPAVIGFYRALVENLRRNQPVSVEPFYYRGGDGFEVGTLWC